MVLLSLFVAAGGIAWAQNSGTLTGTIRSTAGGPIPNAAITFTDNAGTSRSALTGPDGIFTVNVPPGDYRIEVEVPGFKRASVIDVHVVPAGLSRVDVTMEAGETSETVRVTGSAPALQERSGDNTRTYDGEYIRQLPFLDRSQQQMVEMMPGITPPQFPPSVLRDPQQQRIWNANGMPANSNYRGQDGVQSEEPFYRLDAHVPTLESIQEFRVVTSDYDAAQGRAGGSIVQTFSRSGANGVHGGLFAFNSNSYLQARNYFNAKPDPQSRYNFNQFGAAVGGAIIPEHTFLFGSWEGRYLRDQNPVIGTVPTPEFRSGNFSGIPDFTLYDPTTGAANGAGRIAFPNNMIPSSQINPISQALLGSVPLPNRSGYENNYFRNVPFANNSQRFDARLDHRFNQNTTAFVRYGYTNGGVNQDPLLGSIGSGLNSRLRSDTAEIEGLHNFSPTLIGELRIGYNRYDNNIYNASAFGAAGLGFGNLGAGTGNNTIPYIQIRGMGALGQTPSYPARDVDSSFNLVNSWTKRSGRHEIRWGADILWSRFDGFQNLPFGPQGGFLFAAGPTASATGTQGQFSSFPNSFAAFLLGAPSQTGIGGPVVNPSNLQTSAAGYVADTFQVTPRLTFNIGLRYDFFTPVLPRNSSGVLMYDPYGNQFRAVGTDGVNRRGNTNFNTKDFAPRFGFAFRATERTAIRGGYGLSYWSTPMQFGAASYLSSNLGIQTGVEGGFGVAGPFNMIPTLPATTPAGGTIAPNVPLSFTDRTMRTPYVQNFSLMVQQDLGHDAVLDIGYVGTLGRHLPFTRDLNTAGPGMGVAGMPFNQSLGRTAPVLERGTGLTSNYNALQINLTRRFSHGLSFAAAYTYSRAFDYGNGLMPFLNNLDIRSNYGPSDFDQTHLLTISHVWELPFGAGTNHLNHGWISRIVGPWSLNGILRYASGQPFTPTASQSLCACPGNTPRADVQYLGTTTAVNYIPDYYYGFFYPIFTQYTNWGFAQPAAGQFGNAGRNVLRNQGFTNYDLAVTRVFSIVETMKLEFRAEAYNLANSAQFAMPIANVNSANFGQSLSTVPWLGQRTLQFALRLRF